jgi:antitoxin FitA
MSMRCACYNVLRMAHIQIRNVPPELHVKLKVRAAEAGMTLSEYLLETVVSPLATLPTLKEMTERVASLPTVDPTESTADAIRSERARS